MSKLSFKILVRNRRIVKQWFKTNLRDYFRTFIIKEIIKIWSLFRRGMMQLILVGLLKIRIGLNKLFMFVYFFDLRGYLSPFFLWLKCLLYNMDMLGEFLVIKLYLIQIIIFSNTLYSLELCLSLFSVPL